MTEEELKRLIAEAQARYDALSPEQKAIHDRDQRRSFVRGMLPDEVPPEEVRRRVEAMLGKDGT